MHLDDVSDDGQADAQAAILARGRAVGLAKPIEDVRQKSGIDAYAGVRERDLDLALDAPEARFDAPAFIRELDGVREQIPDDLLQTVGVAEDHAVRRLNHLVQNDPFRFGAGPDDIDGGMKDVFDRDRLSVELEAAGDDPRGVEDVLDHLGLRLRALHYHLQRVARLRYGQPAAGEHARPTQDRGERRAQFVRDGGQEFILHPVRRFGLLARCFLLAQYTFEFLFDLLALSDLHHDYVDADYPPAAVLHRVEVEDEMADGARLTRRRRALFDIQSRLASLDHAAEKRLECVGHLRQDLAHRASQVLFHRSAVDLRQTLVGAEVSQIGIHEAQSDRGRGVDRLDIRQLATRLLFALAPRFIGLLALGDITLHSPTADDGLIFHDADLVAQEVFCIPAPINFTHFSVDQTITGTL